MSPKRPQPPTRSLASVSQQRARLLKVGSSGEEGAAGGSTPARLTKRSFFLGKPSQAHELLLFAPSLKHPFGLGFVEGRGTVRGRA